MLFATLLIHDTRNICGSVCEFSPCMTPDGTAGPQACAERLGDVQRPTITTSFNRWPPGLRDQTTKRLQPTTNVMHSGVCWCYCVRTVGVQPHSHQFILILLCENANRQPMCLHNDPLQPTRIEAHSSTNTPAFEY